MTRILSGHVAVIDGEPMLVLASDQPGANQVTDYAIAPHVLLSIMGSAASAMSEIEYKRRCSTLVAPVEHEGNH